MVLRRMSEFIPKVIEGDCLDYLNASSVGSVHLTYFDPPYRQRKGYRFFDGAQPEEQYWTWIREILTKVYGLTVECGAVYFMQREKNAEWVLRTLREAGWTFQNMVGGGRRRRRFRPSLGSVSSIRSSLLPQKGLGRGFSTGCGLIFRLFQDIGLGGGMGFTSRMCGMISGS